MLDNFLFLSLYLFNIFAMIYFIFVNLTYLLLNILAFFSIRTHLRSSAFVEDKILFRHAAHLKPISLIVPAYNEELSVVESVRSLIHLNYPVYEVVLVNDGSTDGTMKVLEEALNLEQVERAAPHQLPAKKVKGIFRSPHFENLLVIDKENGGKADALNAGINFSRYPLFTAIDSDSLLEKDVLLKMVRPFLENPSTIAVGGVIRVVNGCEVRDGEVVKIGLPTNPLAIFQIVEYFRAFLFGRVGWGAINMLLIISGAFGMFRKQAVIEVGGYKKTVGEDIELVVRLHRRMREQKKPYHIRFIPDPVCWTEVPESWGVLSRQRNRWNRGLMDTCSIHRGMFFNPTFGGVGMLGLPFQLFVEGLGWIFEFFGYIMFGLAWILGVIDLEFALVFLSVSILLGITVSVSALIVEEFGMRRFPRASMVGVLILFGVLENFGYRQINAFWRMMGLVDYLRGKEGWGVITRKGFSEKKKG